jgi:hypothetical protein
MLKADKEMFHLFMQKNLGGHHEVLHFLTLWLLGVLMSIKSEKCLATKQKYI